jgi:hypothetical protein
VSFFDLGVNGAENIVSPPNSDDNISNICISAAENNVNIEDNAGYRVNQLTNDGFFVNSNTKMFKAYTQLNVIAKTKNMMLEMTNIGTFLALSNIKVFSYSTCTQSPSFTCNTY